MGLFRKHGHGGLSMVAWSTTKMPTIFCSIAASLRTTFSWDYPFDPYIFTKPVGPFYAFIVLSKDKIHGWITSLLGATFRCSFWHRIQASDHLSLLSSPTSKCFSIVLFSCSCSLMFTEHGKCRIQTKIMRSLLQTTYNIYTTRGLRISVANVHILKLLLMKM